MITSSTYLDTITDRISDFENRVRRNNGLGRTDINKAAERFFCEPLSLVFDGEFKNLNDEEQNYPALDLGCSVTGIGVQVTSTNNREKIQKTLDKFFAHHLEKKFNRVIVLIIGDKQKYKKPFVLKNKFPFSMEEDVWDIPRLLREIEKLPLEKLQRLAEYLDREMATPVPAAPVEQAASAVPAIPVVPAAPAERKLKFKLPETVGFVGRDAVLSKLEEKLRKGNDQLFFITGLGGMGKTELAVRFGQNLRKDFKIHFVRFAGTFRQTVSLGIAPGIENLVLEDHNHKARPEEDIYRETMAVLKACGDDVILIIDNADPADGDFDSLKDDTYRALCGMDLRLVITTRADVPGGEKIGRLADDELYEIIGKYARVSKEDADALIEAVDGHTLTIDLMARAMKGGWKPVTPAMLLEALHKNTLSTAIGKTVGSDYNREDKQQRIYDYLRAVFNVADMPENARQALRCATLLPEGGMDADLFCNALPPEAQEALDALADRAWLRVDNGMATIHPVIRLICHEELKPTDETCGAFLKTLWGQYDKKEYKADKFSQMAELYTTAAEKLENRTGDWSAHGRSLWDAVGQYEKALACARLTLERRTASLPEDHPDLADAYNDMGLVYQGLNDYRGMEEWFGKALAIRERILEPDDVDLAKSYNNMGVAFEEKGDFQSALTNKLKALEIFEKILPENDVDLAIAYFHVGYSYGNLGHYKKALEYQEQALAIFNEVLPADHPHLAASYNDVGLSYENLGDHQKALDYFEKSLTIEKRILSADHSLLADSYNNLGLSYENLGDHQRALDYLKKAIEILQRTLPVETSNLAKSYSHMGLVYGNSGYHRKALEYHQRALQIHQRVRPDDHPDRSAYYNNLGLAYENLGDHQRALDYSEKALAIMEAKLPAEYPYIKTVRDNIAYIKRKLDRTKWMDQIK